MGSSCQFIGTREFISPLLKGERGFGLGSKLFGLSFSKERLGVVGEYLLCYSPDFIYIKSYSTVRNSKCLKQAISVIFITLLECYNMGLRNSHFGGRSDFHSFHLNDAKIGRQDEGSGIASSEVKFSDRGKTNRCESCNTHHTSVNQERKLGDRR